MDFNETPSSLICESTTSSIEPSSQKPIKRYSREVPKTRSDTAYFRRFLIWFWFSISVLWGMLVGLSSNDDSVVKRGCMAILITAVKLN